MSDHNERACFNCGSYLHHEDSCSERTVMDKLDEKQSVAVKALLDYKQYDEDGVEVIASRQAIHEVIDELAALRSQREPVAYPLRLYLPAEEKKALDDFVAAMAAKIYQKYLDGYGGFEKASEEWLNQLLYDHLLKGDPVDVANFCAFLYSNGQRITTTPTRDAALEEAIRHADGCFEAALAEGWLDALANGDLDRIRDIWQRRLYFARDKFSALKNAQEPKFPPSSEWIERKAKLEDGHCVTAGVNMEGADPSCFGCGQVKVPSTRRLDDEKTYLCVDCVAAIRAAQKEASMAERIRALRTVPANAQEQQVCEHGKGITDYCQPCGRINGGGNG